jgi:enediyne biosynthesis protein E4
MRLSGVQGRQVTAIALLVGSYSMARLPDLPDRDRAALAARFAFTAIEFPVLGDESRTIREVHPSVDHIAAWISSVGAAAVLADLDGDQLANDVCLVDPRRDVAVVLPAPGSGSRYAPVDLVPPAGELRARHGRPDRLPCR